MTKQEHTTLTRGRERGGGTQFQELPENLKKITGLTNSGNYLKINITGLINSRGQFFRSGNALHDFN